MAVTNLQNGKFQRISGTIAEVLTEMNLQIASSNQIIYYTDDDTNAVALVGRIV